MRIRTPIPSTAVSCISFPVFRFRTTPAFAAIFFVVQLYHKMQPGAPHDAGLPCSVNSGNIPTLDTMANNAVAFNEGATDLLVRPLGGLQAAEG